MKGFRESTADCHLVALLATISFFSIVTLPDGDWLRVMLAMPLAVLFPGYMVVSALFYNRRIDPIMHLALAVLMSVFITMIAGLFIGISPSKLGAVTTMSAALVLYFLIVIFYVIRIGGEISFRKLQKNIEIHNMLLEKKRKPKIPIPVKENVGALSLDYTGIKTETAFIAVLIVIMLVAGYGVFITAHPKEQTWSDLYMYSTDATNPFAIPGTWKVNTNLSVFIKVSNHEGRTVDYAIVGHIIVYEPQFKTTKIFHENTTIGNGQSLEWNVTFKMVFKGKNTVQFKLYKEKIYDREVHAIIDVK